MKMFLKKSCYLVKKKSHKTVDIGCEKLLRRKCRQHNNFCYKNLQPVKNKTPNSKVLL